ncbi:MAG: hypothetical protein IJU64_00555 [Bacilli bacterium]|nr:hypothetical protein [Bacilli bacterium]
MSDRKNPQILSGFGLRIFAMVFMVIDHIGVLMLNYQADIGEGANTAITVLRAIGRLAFPLFVFLMAEGFHYTRNGWRYLGRIGIVYALIISAMTIYIFGIAKDPNLAHGNFPGPNPFTDLILIGGTLFALNSKGWKKLWALLPAGIVVTAHVVNVLEAATSYTYMWFPNYLRPDYGLFGLCLALGFYLARLFGTMVSKKSAAALQINEEDYLASPSHQRNMNVLSVFFLITATLVFWGISYTTYDPHNMPFESYCILAIPFLYLYSGKRGYNAKWFHVFSYAFFPVHLIILFLIFFVSFGHI